MALPSATKVGQRIASWMATGLTAAAVALAAAPPAPMMPNPGPQMAFVTCAVPEILYGGAVGGGKSHGIILKACRRLKHPGFRGIIFRRHVSDLADLIDKARRILTRLGCRERFGGRIWIHPKGGILRLAHLQHEKDARRYDGIEFCFIAFDELTHFTLEQYDHLLTRLRTPHPDLPCQVVASCNPGGVGHAWVHARFIAPSAPLVPYTDPATGVQRVFIPARLSDTPQLAHGTYAQRLRGIADAAKRAALLEGDWDAFAGTVFRLTEWGNAISLADARRIWGSAQPPRHWPRYRAMDWGTAKPYAVLWTAADESGRLWVYRELYGIHRDEAGAIKPNKGAGHEMSHVARLIVADEREAGERGEHGDGPFQGQGLTGPDLFARSSVSYGSVAAPSETFEAGGVYAEPWPAYSGSRRAKKMLADEMLAFEVDADTGAPRARLLAEEAMRADEADAPEAWKKAGAWLAQLVVVREACPHLCRTLPTLVPSQRDPEDIDSEGEDHAYDAMTAIILYRTGKAWDPSTLPERRPRKGGWRTA